MGDAASGKNYIKERTVTRMNKPEQRRNCVLVIQDMLKLIPSDKEELIKDLNWNKEDAAYKAPEETLQWERTMQTLQKYIPEPTKDWEWQILSIFTTRPISKLEKIFENGKKRI